MSIELEIRKNPTRELELQTWNIAFETVLERLAGGTTFDVACREYHEPISQARFRAWIFATEKRRNAYNMAKAIGAEAVEDEMIRIADGIGPDGQPSQSDVGRSKLQVDTRKWLLQVWNRKRYGDVKQIEQHTTTTIDQRTVGGMSSRDLQSRLMSALGIEDLDPADPADPTYQDDSDAIDEDALRAG